MALRSLADNTVGMSWVGANNCHTTWSTHFQAPILTIHAQYNYCYPSFMYSPATPVGIQRTPNARSVIIIILHIMLSRHIHLRSLTS